MHRPSGDCRTRPLKIRRNRDRSAKARKQRQHVPWRKEDRVRCFQPASSPTICDRTFQPDEPDRPSDDPKSPRFDRSTVQIRSRFLPVPICLRRVFSFLPHVRSEPSIHSRIPWLPIWTVQQPSVSLLRNPGAPPSLSRPDASILCALCRTLPLSPRPTRSFSPPGAPLAEPPFLRAHAHRALLLPLLSLSSLPPPPPRPAEDLFVPEPLGLTRWARKARAGLIWRRACSCAHAHCGASSRLCDGNEAGRRVPSVEEELRKACGASEEPRGRRRPSTRAKHEACPPRTETPKRDCASRRAARTCVKRKRSSRKTRFEARR